MSFTIKKCTFTIKKYKSDLMYYNMHQGKNYILRRRRKMKKVISEVVRFLGDKMIQEVEKGNNVLKSGIVGLHEIEKPECLKKLDRERMAEK